MGTNDGGPSRRIDDDGRFEVRDVVEPALARALVLAAEAGRWRMAERIVGELRAREARPRLHLRQVPTNPILKAIHETRCAPSESLVGYGMARHIASADLPEDIARLAEAQVAAGRFASVEEVVRAGVEAIATLEQKRAAVRAALEEGEASGVFEGDAFASVRAELGLAR